MRHSLTILLCLGLTACLPDLNDADIKIGNCTSTVATNIWFVLDDTDTSATGVGTGTLYATGTTYDSVGTCDFTSDQASHTVTVQTWAP